METIILPFIKTEETEEINSETKEINIVQLLTCTPQLINKYIKNNILPEPMFSMNEILHFSPKAIMEKFGL